MSLFYSFREDEKFYYYRSKKRGLWLIIGLVIVLFWVIIMILGQYGSIRRVAAFSLLTLFVLTVVITIVGSGVDGFRFWFCCWDAFWKNKKIYAERIDRFNAEWKIEK